MIGGTDTDFWRELAVEAGAGSQRPTSAELQRLADAERYERLYSAAARMLDAQGSPTWRGDRWPVERRQRWRELEAALAEATGAEPPGAAADLTRRLACTRDSAGRPVRFADAVRNWDRRLSSAPPRLDRPEEIIAMSGPQYVVMIELLNELRGRLAPGRPVGAVGIEAADLAGVAHDLADSLRAPLGAKRPVRTGRRVAPQPRPGPLNARVSPAQWERLVSAATRAAEAVPSPKQLKMANDFSVRYDVAVAAGDLLAAAEGWRASGWRERHDGIRPDRHLVSGWRWDGSVGRPVGFAERAAEIRTVTAGSRPPWRPTAADPLPEPTDDHSWVVMHDECALIAADLLDELGERMQPGRWIGTITFTASALRDFLPRRIRIAVTDIAAEPGWSAPGPGTAGRSMAEQDSYVGY